MNKEKEKVEPDLVKGLTTQQPEITDVNNYNIGEKYEGYLVVRVDGHVEFYKKTKRQYRNGLVTTKQTDDFTIQENSKCLKVTMVIDRSQLNFKTLLKRMDALVKTLNNMKVI